MKALHEYIIELKNPLNDTFKTESGVELYAHKEFSVDRLSNRIAKVVSTPLLHNTPIEVGYEVMIEPTILYKQIFQKEKQGYTNLIDRDQMHFNVTPNMIVLYRKDENDTWKGYLKNVMLEPIEETEKPIKSNFLYIPESNQKKYKKERAKVLYGNQILEEQGAKNGDEVIINPMGGVNFWMDGKEYWWVRNTEVLGVVEKN